MEHPHHYLQIVSDPRISTKRIQKLSFQTCFEAGFYLFPQPTRTSFEARIQNAYRPTPTSVFWVRRS